MSRQVFDEAIGFTLQWENWKSNDSYGGETIWGVAYRYHPKEVEKMRDMNRHDAMKYSKQFYYEKYWRPASCDDFGKCTAIAMFDSAVNPGLHAAIKCLQRAINVIDDGVIGPKTIKAVEGLSDIHVALLMIGQRKKYYQSKVMETPAKSIFLNGWINRCESLGKFVRTL